MTSLTDRTIAALRLDHDGLVGEIAGLSDEQLGLTSGASEWSVAQVLSHLGSGAEIARAGLQAALAGEPAPDGDFNHGVWDRWNAMGPREQADSFVESDEALVALYEGLPADTCATLTIELAFLPFPLTLSAVLGMRLNEVVHHRWDVQVAFDPAAALATDDATLLLEHLSGDLAFMLGFLGHADVLSKPGEVALSDSGYWLRIAETVSLNTSASEVDSTFAGPVEAAVRLLGGRLNPEHTPAGVTVTGQLTLAELRRVFPGT